MKIFVQYLIVFVVVSFWACNNEEYTQTIPRREVEFRVDLIYKDKDLQTAGNFKTFTAPRLYGEQVGYGGLIVVSHIYSSGGNISIKSFDLSCPHESREDIRVSGQNGNLTVKCKVCGSEYDLHANGNAIAGPAQSNKKGLQQYRVTLDGGDGIYRITN